MNIKNNMVLALFASIFTIGLLQADDNLLTCSFGNLRAVAIQQNKQDNKKTAIKLYNNRTGDNRVITFQDKTPALAIITFITKTTIAAQTKGGGLVLIDTETLAYQRPAQNSSCTSQKELKDLVDTLNK